MSWDIVLFKSRQAIKDLSNLDENELEVIDFNQILDNSFKEIKEDEDHREISRSLREIYRRRSY